LINLKRLQVFMDDNKHVGYYAGKFNANAKSTKTTQMGVSILNDAKTFMSKLLRGLNAYHDPKNAVLYQDTDSAVLPTSAVESLSEKKKKKYFGTNLGQLLNEYPDTLFHTLYCVGPKSYYGEFIGKDLKRYAIVRTKGCPQPKITINLGGEDKNYEMGMLPLTDLKKMEEFEAKRCSYPKELHNHDLRKVEYTLCNRKGEILKEQSYLDGTFFKPMVEDDCVTVCSFGRIDKKIIMPGDDYKKNFAVVRILFDNHRTINKNNWWENPEKRKMIYPDDGSVPFSVPHGHILNK
jgi:hypothetical protein